MRGRSIIDREIVGQDEVVQLYPGKLQLTPKAKKVDLADAKLQDLEEGEAELWHALGQISSPKCKEELLYKLKQLRLKKWKDFAQKEKNPMAHPDAFSMDVPDFDGEAMVGEAVQRVGNEDGDGASQHADGDAPPSGDGDGGSQCSEGGGSGFQGAEGDATPLGGTDGAETPTGVQPASPAQPAPSPERHPDARGSGDAAPDPVVQGPHDDPRPAPAPPPPAPPPVHEPPEPPAAREGRRRRHESFLWKHCRFSYAERDGTPSYQVECAYHSPPGANPLCTRSRSFAPDNLDAMHDAIRYLKAWVVHGHIQASRLEHKDVDVDEPVPSMGELDATVLPEIPEHLLKKRRRLL